TSIATEEIFNVASAAPRVVAADVTVVRAKDGAPLAGTLDDIHQRRIRSELGVGECISAPEIHIPFAIAVPLRAGRHVRDLLHFFSRIFSRTGVGNVRVIAESCRYGGFGFGAFATEKPREYNKDISNWRVVRAAEQG